jgi:hypothetical protein
MKEIPLLFSASMVRATLKGRKDVTRRLATMRVGGGRKIPVPWTEDLEWAESVADKPYGGPGDVIWGREAWRVGTPHDRKRPRDILPPLLARGQGVTVLYEAGGWRSVGPAGREEPNYPDDMPMPSWAGKLRPSIHMPRAFTRIVRPIISVRLEHLHAITPHEARREGVTTILRSEQAFIDAFRKLWDGLNAARGAGWDTNPLVWRIEYGRAAWHEAAA